jgi:hypothetical protein
MEREDHHFAGECSDKGKIKEAQKKPYGTFADSKVGEGTPDPFPNVAASSCRQRIFTFFEVPQSSQGVCNNQCGSLNQCQQFL